ncbi:MAG: pyridoxamine 5'-phosphate oxidase family protein [Prevotellaceae bacterium]|jgi:uncharacterized pyridoxamine 5'-phosphate oxidase family protein|nr:pyridoxamine 5'-phosphate oxidase family protein [Prevotellaceae bacterium]
MKQVLEFFTANSAFFLATADGDSPRVRPFGVLIEVNGKLAFCTSSQKDVYRQMQKNPNVEICSMSPDGTFYRVSGRVELSNSKEITEKFIEAMPALASIYAGKEDALSACILVTATATRQGAAGGKEVRTLY